jgi:hypothetical protein
MFRGAGKPYLFNKLKHPMGILFLGRKPVDLRITPELPKDCKFCGVESISTTGSIDRRNKIV